ncbi:hypothetical protein [Lewinella sp. W8]|uniref:hypothetical protein n=1 Tax=Lewinella sp. W8 TaxID=2528208 RepID=UPI001067E604|nr:hypothetical protein [Lewinella sp. W8]MTB49538.1 hypothetical protein [Lewinella sp. W8]
MKYLVIILSLVFVCFSGCDQEDIRKSPDQNDEVFIVGHVGGWLGSRALMLNKGVLLVSKEQAGVEMNAAQIVNDLEWEVLADNEARNRIEALAAEFPADLFTDDRQSTACTVAAVDGQCPFVIKVDTKDAIRVWTWDSPSTTGPSDVYMRGLSQVVYEVLE